MAPVFSSDECAWPLVCTSMHVSEMRSMMRLEIAKWQTGLLAHLISGLVFLEQISGLVVSSSSLFCEGGISGFNTGTY